MAKAKKAGKVISVENHLTKQRGKNVVGGIAPTFPGISAQVDRYVPKGKEGAIIIQQKQGRPFWKK